MTLGILIATSSGIVLCTDSLVTTSKKHTVLKDIRDEIDLPGDIWKIVNEGEFGYATPHSNLATRDSVVSTSPNVKKMFQIGSHSIAFTLAGQNHWRYTIFDEMGVSRDFPVPLESYVETFVQYVIENLVDNADFDDVVKCLAFVLNFGQLLGNEEYSQNDESTIYSIMGGGYGKNESYPRSFRYSMPGGNSRQSALNACNNFFCGTLSSSFIQSSYSTNWFDQYCQDDLTAAIDGAHAQAWLWGKHYQWSPETITEQLIPIVNENITNCLIILKELTSNNPHEFLQSNNLATPIIISRFWNSYSSASSRMEIEDLVSKINNVSPQMLELILLENPLEHVENFRDRVGTYLSELYPVGYDKQSERIKKSISQKGFNAMSDILGRVMPSFMLSLSQISGHQPSETIEFDRPMWTGLNCVGNNEVVERITNGMNTETFWNISDDIKSYQMHAAERLATIISHKIQSEEPPEYVRFGKSPTQKEEKQNNASEELESHPSAHTQLKLPITDEVGSENIAVKRFDLSGSWKGFYTRVGDSTEDTNKFQFELEIFSSEEKKFSGESSQSSLSTVSISNGKVVEGDRILFDMILEGQQLSQVQVDCEIKAWGIEGSFELKGNRESLIMHRNDSSSNIDSEKLTSDALNQLVRELERFTPNIKSWDVNYTTLPLDSAVEMAHYLMNSTVMKQRFNQELPSVGGPIRTLVITRKEGVRSIEDYTI
jgi:hypothetical protein